MDQYWLSMVNDACNIFENKFYDEIIRDNIIREYILWNLFEDYKCCFIYDYFISS